MDSDWPDWVLRWVVALADAFRAQLSADLGPLGSIAPERVIELRDILREAIGE